jgi:autotransporter-associated beta strand protein
MAVIFSLVAAIAIGLAVPAGAATLTWDANGLGDGQPDGGGAWLGTGQWWDGSANQDWVFGSDANFGNGGAGGAVTLASPTAVGLLTMNAFTGTYTLGTAGSTITLNTGIIMNSGAGIATIISPVTLGGAQSWTNNSLSLLTVGAAAVNIGGNLLTIDGSGNTTISGVIGGTGAGGITKTGTGSLTLSASNTFAGQLSVQNGTLAISTINNASANGRLGNSALSVILGASGQTGTLQYTGATASSSKKFTLATGGTGAFQVDTGATILTLSGVIDGDGAMTKTGPGTLTLSGANIYSGATAVNAGILNFANTLARSSGTTVTAAAAGSIGLGVGIASPYYSDADVIALFNTNTLSGFVLDAGSGVAIDTTAGNFTLSTALTAARALAKLGANTLTLTGVNTYTGATTIVAGTLNANSTAALGDGSATNTLIFSGGTLQAGGTITSASSRGVTLNSTGTIDTNGNAVSIAGVISGTAAAAGLTKTGLGALTLSGANTYTGVTTVSAGVLVLDNATALPGGIGATGGTSALTFNGGVIGLANGDFTRSLAAAGTVTAATFTGNGGWAAYGADRAVNLGGASASIDWTAANTGLNSKTLILGASSATNTVDFQNPLDMLAVARTVQVDNGAADIDGKLSGNITGIAGGNLTKTGNGTLVLSGTNNYLGTTTVSAGTLRVNGNNSGGGAVTVSKSGALGGTGAVAGAVTAAVGDASNAGGAIKLLDGAVGTLTLGSTLTFSGTVAYPNNLCFDLGNGAGGTDKIVVTAAHSATNPVGSVLVNFNQLSGGAVDPGNYTLIQGGAASTFTGYALATTRAGGNVYSALGQDGATNNLQVTVAGASVTEPVAAFWNGGADPWTTLANWTTDATGATGTDEIPGVRTNVTFATTAPLGNLTTNTVDDDFEINSLTFNAAAGGVIIGGTKMLTIDATNANGNTPGNGITAGNTSGTNTISAKIGLGSSQTWTVDAGGALTVSGAVSDFGTGRSLTKAGAGTLTLSGVNTYSGATTISAGVLQIGGAGALNSGNYAADITNNGALQYSSSASQTLSGVISGSGALIKGGAGTLTLSGTNTYSGGTVINAGTLSYTADTNLGAGGYRNIIFGGSGSLTGNGTSLGELTVNQGAVATITASNLTFASATGAGTIKFISSAVSSILSIADGSSFTGNLQVFVGGVTNPRPKIQFKTLSDIVGSGNLQFAGGNSDSGQYFYMALYGDAGPLTLNNRRIEFIAKPNNWSFKTAILQNNNTNAANKFVINTAILNNQDRNHEFQLGGSNTGDNEFAGVIGDSTRGTYYSTEKGILSLIKADAGKWILSGVNTYTGATTINGGTLEIGGSGQLGSGAYAGNIAIAAGATFKYNSSAAQTLQTGVISGAGMLVKDGAGALTPIGANTYTGGTTLTAGTLNINSAGVLATSGPLGNGGAFTINGGTIDNTSGAAIVVANVNPITLGGDFAFSTSAGTSTANNLTLPGAITMAADRTVTLNGLGALTLSGLLTNTGDSVRTLTVNNGTGTGATSLLTIGRYNLTGAGSTGARANIINGTGNVAITGEVGNGVSDGSGLTYSGSGVLTLTGANTYTGATLISGGRLQLDGSAAAGTLATSGLAVGAGGTLGFTAGTMDTLNLAGTFSLGGTVAFDIGAAGYNDAMTVGDFTLTGNSVFTFNPIGGITIGATYTLLTSTSAITTNGFSIAGPIGGLTLTPTINTYTVTVTPVLVEGIWNQAGGGDWSTGNWTNYKPAVAGDAALFGSAITSPAVINVDSAISIGLLRFDNTNVVTIGAAGSSKLTLNNGTSPASVVVNSGSHIIAENVALASSMSVAPASGAALTVSGNLSGAGGVSLTDAGTLTLTGTNSYAGNTSITAGTLEIGGAGQLGSGTYAGNIAIGAGATFKYNSSANQTLQTGVISGDGSLIKGGAGALTLTGENTYIGGTTLTDGTLNINSAGVAATSGPLGNGSALAINGGTIDNTSGAAKVVANVNPITIGGDFAFSTSAGTANNNLTLPGAIAMAADRTVTLNGAGALTLSGLLTNTADSVRTLTVNNGSGTTAASLLTIGSYNLTGPGSSGARANIINGTGNVAITGVVADGVSAGSGLTKDGAGTLTLSGANTYTGATVISGGRLQLNGSAASALTTSGLAVGTGGTLGFTAGAASTLDFAGKTFSLGGTVALDIGATGVNDAMTVGDFTLTAPSVFTFNPIGGIISGLTYTLLTSTNPIVTGGFSITGQTIGRLTFAPTINTNTVTVTPVLYEGIWNQAGGGNWSDDPNWTNYKPAAAGDAALFGSAITSPATITVDTPHTVGYMRFNNDANAYTIGAAGSSNLTLDNGAYAAAVVVNSGSHIIAENVLLTSSVAVAPVSGATLRVSGILSGAGGVSLGDAGTLTLTGANTYTGNTTLVAGKINLGVAEIANVSGPLGKQPANAAGTIILSGGTLQYSAANNNDYSGRFSTAANQAYNVDTNGRNVIWASNLISSGGTLTKSGAGTLTLSGVNTYTGGTFVNGGMIDTIGPSTLGTGTITFTGNGSLQPAYGVSPVLNNSLTVNPGVTGTLNVPNQYYHLTFTGPLSGSGTLSVTCSDNGKGDVTLSNTANTFTGTVQVGTAAQVSNLIVNSLADSVNPMRLYGGTFVLGAGAVSPLVFNSRQIELANTTTGATINNNNGTAANTITINTDLLVTGVGAKTLTLGGANTGANTFAGKIVDGTGSVISLTKADAGTWALGGANTYTGATTISGGTLFLTNPLALQNSVLNTTASIAGTASAGLKTNQMTLTLGGLTGNKDLASLFTTTAGGYGGLMALTLNPGTGVSNSYSGIIADGEAGMTLTKTGLGTQTLSGANSYTGDTIVKEGTLSITAAYLADAADVYLTTDAVFDLAFIGTDTINKLFFDNVVQASGTWGAFGSGAAHTSDFFTGTGLLSVTTSGILPGDTNGDKVVDAADFITLKRNFGTSTGAGVAAGDFNSSGTVNWADLNILTSNMGTGGTPATAPEPCSAMLLVFGAAAVIRRRRKA